MIERHWNEDEERLIASYQDRLLLEASEEFYGEGRWADSGGVEWDGEGSETDGEEG